MSISLRISAMYLFLFCVGTQAFATSTKKDRKPAAAPLILDEADMNKKIDPCQDFYQFACGGFIDRTKVPADKEQVNRVSTPLSDAVDVDLNDILVSNMKGTNPSPSTYAAKLGDVYASCLNANAQTAIAVDLLRKQIQAVHDGMGNLPVLIANMQNQGSDVLFGFGSMQDPTDSSQVIGDASQGGMSFRDPDYYTNTSAKSEEIRKKYRALISSLFVALGEKPVVATKIANDVFAFEKNLASKAFTIAQQEDPSKTTNLIGMDGLKHSMPHFDWDLYFKSLGATPDKLNVDEPIFFEHLDQMLVSVKPEDLEHYLVWALIDRSAGYMGGNFEKMHFDFWDAYMNGAQKMKPRWQLCTQTVEHGMGYALAEAYAKVYSNAAVKEKTISMIAEIKNAFVGELQKISKIWLDSDALQEALEKVKLMGQKVGAPDKFRNYDELKTNPNEFLQNSFNISNFESHRDTNKINKPVDRSEWTMMPWEVNAYYDRANNEFVFPYGILQPPSLDLKASNGANLGSFGGGTIGHELTHGFDNNGSKYDRYGNLKNWWSDKTRKLFDGKAQCYIDQANHYKITELNMTVRGEQTLEESMADEGGVKLGDIVLEGLLKDGAGSNWAGYNERQQYWIAYAQSWCTKYTTANLRSLMTLDTHPPAEFRVNSVLMNRPEFARDFACKTKTRMNPVNKCEVW